MAEILVRQARADILDYTADEIRKVMNAWPCIYCKQAAQRRGSRNEGSGLKPGKPGERWSMDMKGGYVPCYHWNYDSVHIFECLQTGKGFICGFKSPHNADKVIESIRQLRKYTNARSMKIEYIRSDAGSVETSDDVETYCADKHILLDPVPPKAQHMNTVESYIQVLSNKKDAAVASACQGSTLTGAIWYSAIMSAAISLDTQIRPTFNSTRTPYETFEGTPPNLDEIFPYRLGQLVTVTALSDRRCKTDHNLAGIPCYVLHPEPAAQRKSGTWLYCPHDDVQRAYLRYPDDIQELEYAEIPNQSKQYFRPQHSTHKSYPTAAIMQLANRRSNSST
jgi:hypothetical protein